MFSRQEELNNILTFSQLSIIKALLLTLPTYDLQKIRQQLDPHWSDGYQPSLDEYFDNKGCKLCGKSAVNRKQHFHEECEVVKKARKESNSIKEFEEKIWGL